MKLTLLTLVFVIAGIALFYLNRDIFHILGACALGRAAAEVAQWFVGESE